MSVNTVLPELLLSVVSCIVLGVMFFILLFSLYYFFSDIAVKNYYQLLLLFVVSMLILINADNQIMMLLGWEGVGITSFLLIKFWSNRSETVKSSLKALLVNKIGDVFFIVFIIVTLVLVSTDSILIFDQIAFLKIP